MVTAHLGRGNALARHWRSRRVFAVKVPMVPFHTMAAGPYAEAPSPVTMLLLLTGAMSKMGVYGLLRIALPIFGVQIAAMRTPLLVRSRGLQLSSWAHGLRNPRA